MTPEEEAYKLAEERIAEAKADGWKYLNISGSETEISHGEERRAGDKTFRSLERIPPQIAELTWLENLHAGSSSVSDISVLQGLIRLRELDIGHSDVDSIAPLAALIELQVLGLKQTHVSDISALSGLTNLEEVYLDYTQVHDLNGLECKRKLRQLWLSGTQVSDLTPLQNSDSLDRIILDQTQVYDISPLENITSLWVIALNDTPLLRENPTLREIYNKNFGGERRVQAILAWQREHGKLPVEKSARPIALTVDNPSEPEAIEPPHDAAALAIALETVSAKIAFSDVSYSDGVFDLRSRSIADFAACGLGWRDAVKVLIWQAGEIQKIAESNKLAANDASRAAQYVAELAETRPSGAMLRAVGGAILPEIALALQEDRLAPGDAQICAAFRLAHETLLEQFFPGEATAQAETDAIAVEPPIAPDAFVGPARELGGVVRDHEAMSGALKDFVVQIELIAEDHMRLAMAGPDAERDLAFVRFAKRAGAFIRQFVLRVQEVILLEGMSPGDKASVYGLSIALMDKLMPIWSKLVELLPQLF